MLARVQQDELARLGAAPGTLNKPAAQGGAATGGADPSCIQLVMVEACYDERSSRTHVHKLRQLLAPPQMTPASPAIAQLDKDTPEAHDKSVTEQDIGRGTCTSAMLDVLFLAPIGPEPLPESDVRKQDSKDPPCLKSITLSSLNPVPSRRRLHGDLAYYDIVLADHRSLCVTACVRGFYVNKSAAGVLDPARHDAMPHAAYTLVGLLSSFSPAFKRNWAKLIAGLNVSDPIVSMPPLQSVYSWVAQEHPHTADAVRVEEAMRSWYAT